MVVARNDIAFWTEFLHTTLFRHSITYVKNPKKMCEPFDEYTKNLKHRPRTSSLVLKHKSPIFVIKIFLHCGEVRKLELVCFSAQLF